MRQYFNVFTAYIIMGILIILVGILQSWGVALAILNLCLISAVMTMGANIQWGYAGLIKNKHKIIFNPPTCQASLTGGTETNTAASPPKAT